MASTAIAASQACGLKTAVALNSGALKGASQASFSGGARLNVPQISLKSKRLQAVKVKAAEQEVEAKTESQQETYAPPPSRRAFTGYVEKDTAGQTNIYAVEPTVYVGDSAFSTNGGGVAGGGSSGTLIISTFLAVAAISGAAAILFTVNGQPAAVGEKFSGPPLSYYVQKFKDPGSVPATFIDASLAAPEIVEKVTKTFSEPEPVIDDLATPAVAGLAEPATEGVAVPALPVTAALPSVGTDAEPIAEDSAQPEESVAPEEVAQTPFAETVEGQTALLEQVPALL